MSFKERLKRTGIICLFPVISYGILGPLEIYCGNKKDFSFELTDFIWLFIGFSVAIWVLISVLSALFNEKINEKICTGILAFGMASYIQNMFMNIKLSEINGGPMDWSSLNIFTYVNLGIWIVIIGSLIILGLVFKKSTVLFMYIAAFFSAIQLVAVFSLVVSVQGQLENTSESDLQMSGEGQFDVATDHNIIVFVLDTFGNTQLENVLDTYPNLLEEFSDFTYYNNADCHYYTTFPSMTHILTGNEFDFSMNGHEWLNSAWKSERATRFYELLENKKYVCNLYSNIASATIYGDNNNLYGKFNNIQLSKSVVNYGRLSNLMWKMSIYKYFPYILKPYFEVLTHEFGDIVTLEECESSISDNAQFYKALTERRLSINSEYRNGLIVQHLFGMHSPYTINENAEFMEESTLDKTVQGLITICKEYVSQLKELGVYEEATIIITADHGSWWENDQQPVLLVKKSGEKHEQVEINSAPVSTDDFQATILSLLGEDYREYGTSIFDWKEGETRDRTVYMIDNNQDYPEVPGLLYNVYLEYNYSKDKEELDKKVNVGPDRVIGAMPW